MTSQIPPAPIAAPTAKSRTRCSWTAEERSEWIALLEQSGRGLSEFCRANGLPESTVSLWRKQRRVAAVEPNDTGEFVEVAPAAEPRSALHPSMQGAPVIVHLSGDVCLEVATGTDPTWLADLIRAVRDQ